MDIEILSGTAPRLYELVAPLVMSRNVLRQNNNYPFKTSRHHLWFIALEEKIVMGFIPVEIKNDVAVINNYYIKEESNKTLSSLINSVLIHFKNESVIRSITHTRHKKIFLENHFFVTQEWKLYIKMEYKCDDEKKTQCI